MHVTLGMSRNFWKVTGKGFKSANKSKAQFRPGERSSSQHAVTAQKPHKTSTIVPSKHQRIVFERDGGRRKRKWVVSSDKFLLHWLKTSSLNIFCLKRAIRWKWKGLSLRITVRSPETVHFLGYVGFSHLELPFCCFFLRDFLLLLSSRFSFPIIFLQTDGFCHLSLAPTLATDNFPYLCYSLNFISSTIF